jgi:hypothetical protein
MASITHHIACSVVPPSSRAAYMIGAASTSTGCALAAGFCVSF